MKDFVLEHHKVFPGVELTYESIHLSAVVEPCHNDDQTFEIRHCQEGRMECQSDGEYFCLGPGDLSIGRPGTQVRSVRYPLSHCSIMHSDKGPLNFSFGPAISRRTLTEKTYYVFSGMATVIFNPSTKFLFHCRRTFCKRQTKSPDAHRKRKKLLTKSLSRAMMYKVSDS